MKRPGFLETDAVLFLMIAIVSVEVVLLLGRKYAAAELTDSGVWLGVETMEITPAIQQRYDLRSANGLLASRVFMESPAEIAGVRTGDVLRKWDGRAIVSGEQLWRSVQMTEVNKNVKVVIERGGKPLLVHIRLVPRPGT